MSPITHTINGAEWTSKAGDLYKVTGVLVNGKRFKPIVTSNWFHANCINLYKGTKWLMRDGKQYLIVRSY